MRVFMNEHRGGTVVIYSAGERDSQGFIVPPGELSIEVTRVTVGVHGTFMNETLRCTEPESRRDAIEVILSMYDFVEQNVH